MRQTIIGVAAPANAPAAQPMPVPVPLAIAKLSPPEPVSDSFPAGGTIPDVDPLDEKQDSNRYAESEASEAREQHKVKNTLQGISSAAQVRDDSRPQAVGLGIPTEEHWNVVIPRIGTVEMSAPDIVRAFVEGKLTRETLVWRDGLDGWKPIHEVDSLKTQFRRAGVPLSPSSASAEPVASRHIDPKKAAILHSVPPRPKSDGPRAMTEEEPLLYPRPAPPASASQTRATPIPKLPAATDNDESEEATRIFISPWEVPDVGAKAAARLADSAGFPPRQNSAPPMRSTAPRNGEQASPERPSRRPDIGPRDTVRGQLVPLSSVPPTNSQQPLNSHLAPVQQTAPATVTARSASVPVEPIAQTIRIDPGESTIITARSPFSGHRLLGSGKRARFRWGITLLVVLATLGTVTISYRTKQPRIAYDYLHRHGWDARIDQWIGTVTPKLHYAGEHYVKQPWQAMSRKLKHLF